MRQLAHRISTLMKRRPWLAATGIVLLAGALFLPSLHHLADHHDAGADGGDCPVCLLLNLNFLALPVLFTLEPARRAKALLAVVTVAAPAAAAVRMPGARAPPLSN